MAPKRRLSAAAATDAPDPRPQSPPPPIPHPLPPNLAPDLSPGLDLTLSGALVLGKKPPFIQMGVGGYESLFCRSDPFSTVEMAVCCSISAPPLRPKPPRWSWTTWRWERVPSRVHPTPPIEGHSPPITRAGPQHKGTRPNRRVDPKRRAPPALGRGRPPQGPRPFYLGMRVTPCFRNRVPGGHLFGTLPPPAGVVHSLMGRKSCVTEVGTLFGRSPLPGWVGFLFDPGPSLDRQLFGV